MEQVRVKIDDLEKWIDEKIAFLKYNIKIKERKQQRILVLLYQPISKKY